MARLGYLPRSQPRFRQFRAKPQALLRRRTFKILETLPSATRCGQVQGHEEFRLAVELSPSEHKLIDRLGLILDENHFPPGAGQILGSLLIVGEELSAVEISGTLG